MNEALWRSEKFEGQLDDIRLPRLAGVAPLSFERLHDDALDTPDVDQLEAQSPAAGGIDAVWTVLVGEPK